MSKPCSDGEMSALAFRIGTYSYICGASKDSGSLGMKNEIQTAERFHLCVHDTAAERDSD